MFLLHVCRSICRLSRVSAFLTLTPLSTMKMFVTQDVEISCNTNINRLSLSCTNLDDLHLKHLINNTPLFKPFILHGSVRIQTFWHCLFLISTFTCTSMRTSSISTFCHHSSDQSLTFGLEK